MAYRPLPLFGLFVVPLLLGQLAFGSTPCRAQENPSGPAVAQVLDIEGPRLMTDRLTGARWFQAFPGMRSRLQERLRTDEKTYALLEFRIGGRAGISPGTEVEVLSQRELQVVGDLLRVKSGAFWASVDEQEQRLQIQTSGGVIGIEGTELLVRVDPDLEVTEVLLFEGQARIQDNDGNEYLLLPGDYAEFGGGVAGCVLSYPPSALREVVVERFPIFSSFLSARGVTTIPLGTESNLFRGHLASRPTLDSLLERLGPESVVQTPEGSAPAPSLDSPEAPGDQDWVTGLSPNRESTGSQRPAFGWDPVPGAESYLVVLSSDPSFDELDFVGRSVESRFELPAGAPSLAAGRYYYRVVPVRGADELVGRAAESWFETAGWSSEGFGPVEERPLDDG